MNQSQKDKIEKKLYYGYELQEVLAEILDIDDIDASDIDATGAGGDSDVYICYEIPGIEEKFPDLIQEDRIVDEYGLNLAGTIINDSTIDFQGYLYVQYSDGGYEDIKIDSLKFQYHLKRYRKEA